MSRVLISSERARSSSRVIGFRSAGELIRSRIDIFWRFSGRACYHEISDLGQLLREQSLLGQSVQTVVYQVLCPGLGAFDPEQRREGAFPERHVPSRGLSALILRGIHV